MTQNRGKEGRRGRVKVEGRREGGVEGGAVEKEIWVMMAKSQAEERERKRGRGTGENDHTPYLPLLNQ